jgi:hypothetical protein
MTDEHAPNRQEGPGPEPHDDALQDDDPGEHPFSPMAIVILLVLVVGGIYVVFTMRDMASTQDCVSSGRRNCAPIDR